MAEQQQQQGSPPDDGRTPIWVADGIFQPDHNKVIRFITAQFSLQTCDEGYSWKRVTEDQRQWYWEGFIKKYRWPNHLDDTIKRLWYKNIATLYRRTIHSWRRADRHPQTVSNERWASWMLAWSDERWLASAAKNKDNRNSEPAGPGTGTTKHIAGSKTYSGHCQKLREQHHRDPTSWELYVHTHRHDDGSFVDERSRLVDQAMQAYMHESLTPLDDGTIPSPPTSGEVNSMFNMVVGGPKKGRMYGCGSMASTIYPDEMAQRPRGGSRSSSRGSQDTEKMRAEWEAQKSINEHLRIDLQATQSTLEATQQENASLKDRMTSLEDQVRRLIAGVPQPQPQPQPHTSQRFLYGRGSSSRGRALSGSSYFDDPSSHNRRWGKVLRYSPEYIPPSQDSGHDDDDGDSDNAHDDDDGDGDNAHDNDENQSP
ncbi:uncharacterized protein LOC142540255 [Primulina tabacum]|uniref:uncharacterized protein LOC142540255 n=1 Tax=Primulina tabacum TaxID=48773 RepID=UPI003F5A540E